MVSWRQNSVRRECESYLSLPSWGRIINVIHQVVYRVRWWRILIGECGSLSLSVENILSSAWSEAVDSDPLTSRSGTSNPSQNPRHLLQTAHCLFLLLWGQLASHHFAGFVRLSGPYLKTKTKRTESATYMVWCGRLGKGFNTTRFDVYLTHHQVSWLVMAP